MGTTFLKCGHFTPQYPNFHSRQEDDYCPDCKMNPRLMIFRLKGIYGVAEESNTVWLNGQKLDIKPSQAIIKHSLEFAWGYLGSGPAQLALAILLELRGRVFAMVHYQQFKEDIIAQIPNENFPEQEFTYTFKTPEGEQ